MRIDGLCFSWHGGNSVAFCSAKVRLLGALSPSDNGDNGCNGDNGGNGGNGGNGDNGCNGCNTARSAVLH